MKFYNLRSLFTTVVSTLIRFPLVMLSASLGVALLIYLDLLRDSSYNPFYITLLKGISTCSLGLTLCFSLSLIGERRIIPMSKWPIQFCGLVLLAFYFYLLLNSPDYISIVRFVLFTIVLHLLCAFAPFIGKNEPNGFWQFNKVLFISFLTAFLYSFVLYVGICIAVVGVHELFEVEISYKVYSYWFYFIAGIFNTLVFLSRVPSDFIALQASDDYPKGLKVFTQFILLPLVTLYLLLLYGYETKILFASELPKGWVSYLVVAFSIVGILSLLLIHPIRNNTGNKWILTFSRWFYLALFPLLVLLFVAIFTRVAAYGITELRYFILLLALWLGGMAAYFLIRKEASIKVIPVSLCLLGFFSSFGPWGAFYVASESQVRRFETILEKNQLVKDSQIVSGSRELLADDMADISSVLNFLEDRGDLNKVSHYFGPKADSVMNDTNVSHAAYRLSGLMKLVNLEFDLLENQQTRYITFEAKETNAIAIKGFDYALRYNQYEYQSSQDVFVVEGKEFRVQLDKLTGVLSLKESTEEDSLRVNVLDVCKSSLINNEGPTYYEQPANKMVLETQNYAYSARIMVHNIQISHTPKEDLVKYVEADILIKEK